MTLDQLKAGERGHIRRLTVQGALRKRLQEMGFVSGAEVLVIKYAPLRDPVEYLIKGYHISLRHEEAAQILIDKID
ncbi:MAG: FeoA family protein [Thermodesulfobacteriota bacterium]